jgi:hypothetical protein
MFNRLTSLGPAFIWAAACLAAMIAGGLGPWATVFGIADISGTRGDGWFLIVGGAAGGALLVAHAQRSPSRRWQPVVLTLISAVCVAVAGIDLVDIGRVSDGGFGVVDPAWGVFVSFVASLSAAAAGLLIAIARPFARE